MNNYIQPGNILDLTAPAGGVVSGVPVLIGALLVIAGVSAAEGKPFSGAVEGVFDVPAANSQAWVEGALVYWDDTAKRFTTTVGSNTKKGVAVAAKGSSAVVGRVKLIQTL